MSSYLLYISINLSVLLAALVLMIRLRHLPPLLYPFAALITIGALNELLSVLLVYNGYTNSINGNIYILIEFLLLLWQFYNWGTLNKSRLWLIIILGSLLWIADNVIISSLSANNSLTRVVYAFLFVFLSIDMINRRIVFGKEKLLHTTSCLIAIGILFYYACKTFVEVFNAFDLSYSNTFYAHIWFSLSVVNAITNILYAIALIWIPTKQQSLLLS